MENNLSLFEKSPISLRLNNSDVPSNFAESELYLRTENQPKKCCWKQAKNGNRHILYIIIRMFPVIAEACRED